MTYAETTEPGTLKMLGARPHNVPPKAALMEEVSDKDDGNLLICYLSMSHAAAT